MKPDTKKRVLSFMMSVDTRYLNTNNFVADFIKFQDGNFTEEAFRGGISIESITRSRRYRLELEKANYIKLGLSRSEQTKDSEDIYKETFRKTPIGMY